MGAPFLASNNILKNDRHLYQKKQIPVGLLARGAQKAIDVVRISCIRREDLVGI